MIEFNALRPEHRKEYNDCEWARQQPHGEPYYFIGDIVEFKAGGIGIITEVSRPHDGHPSSYAVSSVEGKEPPPYTAWHYELDFKELIGASAIRSL